MRRYRGRRNHRSGGSKSVRFNRNIPDVPPRVSGGPVFELGNTGQLVQCPGNRIGDDCVNLNSYQEMIAVNNGGGRGGRQPR